jgi:DNA (cytosine-5)-methyltransferase 1
LLSKHFPETKLFTDIKDVTGEQLRATGFIPDRGIITAGFPCQDLSVAGLRKGLAGSRSGLFWEIIRLVDETQPRYLIIENVAGLLSSQSGRDLGIVIEALVQRRYGIAWRVLDSQYFGVPQRRRRIFIVASLTDHRSPVEILFEPESRTGHLEPSTKKKQKITRLPASGTDIHTWTKSRRASSDTDYETWVESDITPTLNQFEIADTRTTTIVTKSPELFDATRNADVRFYDQSPTMKARWGTGGNNVPMLINNNDQTNTICASIYHHGSFNNQDVQAGHLVKVLPIQDGREIIKNQNGLGVGEDNAPSYTLDATGAQAVASQGTVRRLTPTECERLQAFPDGWTAGQSDSARYKQLGNAVTVSVVAWIVNRMVSINSKRVTEAL